MIDGSLISTINHFLDFLLTAAAISMAVTVAQLRLGGALLYRMEGHYNGLIRCGAILLGCLALIPGAKSLVEPLGKQAS